MYSLGNLCITMLEHVKVFQGSNQNRKMMSKTTSKLPIVGYVTTKIARTAHDLT